MVLARVLAEGDAAQATPLIMHKKDGNGGAISDGDFVWIRGTHRDPYFRIEGTRVLAESEQEGSAPAKRTHFVIHKKDRSGGAISDGDFVWIRGTRHDPYFRIEGTRVLAESEQEGSDPAKRTLFIIHKQDGSGGVISDGDRILIRDTNHGQYFRLEYMSIDVLYAKRRYQNYFKRVIQLSQQYPPAYQNAAHGGFRDSMVGDPGIMTCGLPSTLFFTSDGDGNNLLTSYFFCYHAMQRAFINNSNFDTGINSATLWPRIGDIISQVWEKVKQMVKDHNLPTSKADVIEQAINTVFNSLNGKLALHGRHMNGHISTYISDAANWTLTDPQSNLAENFAVVGNTYTGKVVEVLKQTLTNIAGLPTQGHNPWLRSEWQIEFQTILMTCVYVLDELE